MKKQFILILLIIFLCGCEAKYHIRFRESRIEEEITITEKNSVLEDYDEDDQELFEDELAYWELDFDYYKKENIKDKDVTGYKYKSNFNYEQFGVLTGIKRCYEEFNYSSDPTIKIETSKDFLCLNEYKDLDKFEVTIQTDYKVVNQNADKVSGNEYTWIITKKNHKNKPIIFEAEKKYPAVDSGKKLGTGAILVIILFISLIIINMTVLKKDKKEKANY